MGCKFISIDIETLGLNPNVCDVIEFGAVYEDTDNQVPLDKLPRFHRYLFKENGMYRGELEALAMHGKIFKSMVDIKRAESIQPQLGKLSKVNYSNILSHFRAWLCQVGYFNIENTNKWCKNPDEWPSVLVAGKNFSGFDLNFIKSHFESVPEIRFKHRTIDPSMMYFDPKVDEGPPSLSECRFRAGLNPMVSHNAIDDAISVIEVLRMANWNKFPLPVPEE